MSIESTSAFSLQPSAFDAESPKVHDCWNTIGVDGNGSCRELVKFVHCRNCPVYSAAGLQLLDRPLPPGYRREWTEHFARVKKLGTPARTSVLIFRVASEWVALPTTAFQEIAEHRAMHSLPHRRGKIVLGLVNIRGELTICVSLARTLGMEDEIEHQKKARAVFDRLLVAHWHGGRLAFPADGVHRIQHFQKDELGEPPATVS
ncbi:MAG TPA: chemotaxis protein CheW, partial [Verrucomicrobiota bacterium]|nr:chemotaxis protein CheW [Verrucomicrobiota bacterium]